ncbi:Hsp20/alpha crystallin family protein [Chitiniphilus purpureus]|uniref:Hsp20/alpha crystallin family protein n=1 Tax=Chitiniphilus purpureus TaxID=2981137 RepID=A0ABY6DPC1_9NEIS|nr:Hsp20/alpha crystallin family protein [Chitiniphilus sp. CD1]UXY13753.1 Hsp20/alpha crystallin family protein [Chitiniphilus sp. CD1]
MRSRDLSSWMWGDALSLLEQAERLHQRFCRTERHPTWEPPVDVLEDEHTLVVYVALPGVPASAVQVRFHPAGVTVSGVRRFPGAPSARIHRIEIPYGHFERHILLPLDALEPAPPHLADGCLVLKFDKLKEAV